MDTVRRGTYSWLGAGVDYNAAWALQRALVDRRAANQIPDTLLLLEHAPVYTAGRRSLPEHVLADLSAPLIETDRGGQTTYHGPGQLVGYPIISLADLGLGPKEYVRALEQGLIEALGQVGVEARTEEGLTGVWTDHGKIAAIGVRINKGIAHHGFALNAATDLTAYEPIIPCGIADRPMTSVSEVLGRPVSVHEMVSPVVEGLGAALGIRWTRRTAASLLGKGYLIGKTESWDFVDPLGSAL